MVFSFKCLIDRLEGGGSTGADIMKDKRETVNEIKTLPSLNHPGSSFAYILYKQLQRGPSKVVFFFYFPTDRGPHLNDYILYSAFILYFRLSHMPARLILFTLHYH